jgi:hypothetical protein
LFKHGVLFVFVKETILKPDKISNLFKAFCYTSKHSFPVSQNAHCFSNTKTKYLIVFREGNLSLIGESYDVHNKQNAL